MPHSPFASAGATRAVLEEFGLTAKYALGQNFLVNDDVVGRILDLAQLSPTDVVLEVGPGIGTLTRALLPHVAAVAAIEADRDMRAPLLADCADYSERLALVMGDALRVTPDQVRRALAELCPGQLPDSCGGAPTCLVANLPYAVAATLVLKLMESPDWAFLRSATVMVQSEVADRICAEPGSKIYGAYTLKMRLHARVTGRFQVPPSCFFPAPHVDSAVIRLDRVPAAERLSHVATRACAEVIDAAFAQRRKTIRNSMASARRWGKAQLDEAYGSCGIEGTRRAETLELPEYVALARALCPEAFEAPVDPDTPNAPAVLPGE